MEIILTIFYTAVFILLIFKMKFFAATGLPRKIITAVFLLKIMFGFILWFIYTCYYTYRDTNDAFRFFDDAVLVSDATKGHFLHFIQILFGINSDAEYLKHYLANTIQWYQPYDYGIPNDSRTLIRFNAFVLFFSFGYYQVHMVFMNFLSLIGLVALYKMFAQILPGRKLEIFFAVFLIPTVLFWGSGAMKEGLILCALGLFLLTFYRIIQRGITAKLFITLILSLCLLCLVKIYVLVCLIPAVISIIAIKFSGQKLTALKFLAVHILLIIFVLNIKYLLPSFHILESIQIKQRDFYNVAEIWNAGSAIDIGHLEPTFLSFVQHAPQALVNTFFRPHLLEANSVLLLAAALENLIFTLAIFFYLFHFKKPPKENISWLLLAVSFVTFLALLIGWTTPIMGAIVRYKLPMLPFLIFVLLLISDKPKFISRIESWKKL